jgi:Mg-chelatase subunit ChlD
MPTPNQTKLALRNFAGKPVKFFRVERDDLTGQAPKPVKTPTHHVIVIDRSGSMYGSMDGLKTMVEKLLTLQEFNDPLLRVSLVSYSSQGDVKLHFARVTVDDVMKANSPYLGEIRSLRATALTCISQGLVMASTLVEKSDTTCITLHTDGFANDASPAAEGRAIQAAVDSLKAYPNVFVNTVGYHDWCDYGLLSKISNQLSGSCVQAKNLSQVYTALHDTTKLLTGQMSPALEVGTGKADYTVFVSKSGRKILGSTDNMVVRGLAATDDRAALRFYEITEAEYGKLPDMDDTVAALAYARTQVAEGNLNAAKYSLVASRATDLLTAHSRALVSSDVAAFSGAVEEVVFGAAPTNLSSGYGLSSTGPSMLAVLAVLAKYTTSLMVNLKAVTSGYKRRGLKRVPGVRLDDGALQKPTVESRYREESEWVAVNGFELNRNTATVNMLVSQPIDIYPTDDKTASKIASVAGVNLDSLKAFNNYTLVGDGVVNLNALTLRTTDKRCHRELKELGLVTGEYAPNEAFTLDFSKLPLVDYDTNFGAIAPNEVMDLAGLTVLSKILSGMVKGESVSLTSEQVAELKTHYLSPSLYFSPPTTNEYAVLADAIAQGKVDTRLSYKIDVGIPALTSVSKLKSGNEYLQRRFTLDFLGKSVEKPTLDQLTLPGSVWGVKKLTARTQLDKVDELSYPIYEGIVGTGVADETARLLKLAGCIDPAVFLKTLHGGDHEASLIAVSDALVFVNRAVESVYDRVRPLAFYVGATGLVPDSLDAKALNADQFAAAYPDAKLSKAEKEEGTFFVLPNGVVLTVYVKPEFFTVS